MIKLRVNKNFFLDMDSDVSIMEGSDINIVLELSDDFPVEIVNNITLDYRNGKYRDRDLIVPGTTIDLQKPFNVRGYLELQVIFDTQTSGWRKTNTVTTKIHRSINAGPVDRDLEEIYEILRNMQNEITELEANAGTSIHYVEETQTLQLMNSKGKVISETIIETQNGVAIAAIEWSEEEGAYILTMTDETTQLLSIPPRVE